MRDVHDGGKGSSQLEDMTNLAGFYQRLVPRGKMALAVRNFQVLSIDMGILSILVNSLSRQCLKAPSPTPGLFGPSPGAVFFFRKLNPWHCANELP